MGLSKMLKEGILKLDFFVTSEVLRVNSQPDYKTVVGGLTSITIIIVLLATFYNKIIDTLDKIVINSSFDSIHYDDPQKLQLSTFENGRFMFGVQIWHHDLNNQTRFFDVILRNTYYENGSANITHPKTRNITLQPCTKDHWIEYPQVIEKFDRINMQYWLCLPKNQKYEIYGKFASRQSMTLDVAVMQCTNSSDNPKPCASPDEIEDLFQENGNFYYTIYFLNALINPSSKDYLSYYLQDSNYIMFDRNGGQEAQIWVQDFTITTDESILPFAEEYVDQGSIITKSAIKNRYNTVNGLYGTFFFFKSPNSQKIIRSFEKLDEILAYIGGLFGTIAMGLFACNKYNQYSFQIAMAGYLYHRDDNGQENLYKKYHFGYFLASILYGLLRSLNIKPNWLTIQQFYDCNQEMVRQLDILYLFKRVNFVQRSMQLLVQDHQAKGLRFMRQLTLQQARQIRLKYKMKSRIKSQMVKKSKALNKKLNEGNNKEENKINPTVSDLKNENINADVNRQNTKDSKSSQDKQQQEDKFVEQQCYTSQSEQQEQQNKVELIQSLKILAQQKQSNTFSRKIWQIMDTKVKEMFTQYMKNKQTGSYLIENDQTFQNLLFPQHKYTFTNQNQISQETFKVNNSQQLNPLNINKSKFLPKIHRQNARKIILNEYLAQSLYQKDEDNSQFKIKK